MSPITAGAARGRFITFEGGEGAGKSTQLVRLAQSLRDAGIDVVTTREPGGSPGAEAIRGLLVSGATGRWDPRTETLLHVAARREHLVRTVWPAIESGRWVISDRFADSTAMYQGLGQGVPPQIIKQLHNLIAQSFQPDLTLILDLPVEDGLTRARARGGDDRYERMGLDFHRRLRAGFLDLTEREPERCRLIDAASEVDTVAERVWTVVRKTLLVGKTP